MVRNKLLRLAMLLVLALQALTACGSDRGSSATNDATAVHSEADLFKDFGFVLSAQMTTSIRASKIAVNIEVTMPNDRVTANPLIGPEPKI